MRSAREREMGGRPPFCRVSLNCTPTSEASRVTDAARTRGEGIGMARREAKTSSRWDGTLGERLCHCPFSICHCSTRGGAAVPLLSLGPAPAGAVPPSFSFLYSRLSAASQRTRHMMADCLAAPSARQQRMKRLCVLRRATCVGLAKQLWGWMSVTCQPSHVHRI
jgi:hypothetical protein